MTGRSVPEWCGKTPDAKVPERVKLRIWRRQCGDTNFAICPLTSMPLRWTDAKHLHHIKALCNGGEHCESNLTFVHAKANTDEAKREVAERAKNDDRAKTHAGLRDAPARKIESRGFQKVEKPKKGRSVKSMPRRAMFR